MSIPVTDELLEEFLPTIRHWARHYAHRRQLVLDVEDLAVAGVLGLMDAAGRYDPRHGSQFKTYAEFRIRGEIVDEIRRQDWMGRTERRRQRQYRGEMAQLTQRLGRSPSTQELADVLPFTRGQVESLAKLEHAGPAEYVEGQWAAPDGPDLDLREEVGEMLAGLPPVEATILRMHYLADKPLAAIAAVVGLSVGRVSQLHHQALARLKKDASAA